MFKQKVLSTPGEVAVTQNSSSVEFQRELASVSVAAAFTVSSPAVKTFVDGNVSTGADQVTVSAHGYKTGLKVRLTTTGTLPGGLATATDYYIVLNDGNTIQFATSAANASSGSAINITSAAGGGTHTITPQAVGANIILQTSVDGGTNWIDLATTAISATGNLQAIYVAPATALFRAQVAITGGQMTVGDIYLSANDDC